MKKYRKSLFPLVTVFITASLFSCKSQADSKVQSSSALSFSHDPGIYTLKFSLTVTPEDSNNTIFYTKDGSEASAASPQFSGTKYSVTSLKNQTSGYVLTPAVKAWQGYSGYSYIDRGHTLSFIEVNQEGQTVAKKRGSFIINSRPKIPVICLTAPPESWIGEDGDGGLYNTDPATGSDEKYRAWLEYFDYSKNEFFSLSSQMKRGGNWTRYYPVRTINLNFKKDQDGNKNKAPKVNIFNSRKGCGTKLPVEGQIKRLRLHVGGNDLYGAMFTDAFIQQLAYNAGLNVGTAAYRPCILYLNGEYWGFYMIREHYNADYFEYNYGINDDNILYVDRPWNGDTAETSYARYHFSVKDGDQNLNLAALEELYLALGYDWASQTLYDQDSENYKDFTQDSVYEDFCKLVDIDSLIDLILVEGYAGNWDFMFNNLRMWRSAEIEEGNTYGDCRWRFVLHDLDVGFSSATADAKLADSNWTSGKKSYFDYYLGNERLNHSLNGQTKWYLPLCEHIILSQPAKNQKFKKRLLERAQYIEEAFSYDNASVLLESFKKEAEPYMENRAERWGYNKSLWESGVSQKDSVLQKRGDYFIKQVKAAFGI
ncbi:CotH kinase family protein [Treponema sp.]|uniref:CotH kinase family protein n=1 Tax=Treponema sp. TaxID=166 RepID=UPI0025DC8B23|nr:CotH kinase family protein [Treponema sp.]MCR5217844.1 CotH kinase family protein [Treponema sp.]